MQAAKTQLSSTIATYAQPSIDYKKNRDDAVAVITDIKATYTSALACYQAKVDAGKNNFSNIQISQTNIALAAIAGINETIKNIVDPKIASLSKLALDAGSRSTGLTDIQNQIDNAADVKTLSLISQQYTSLIQGKTLTTTVDVQNSKNDLDAVRADSAGLKQDATTKLQSCISNI